MFLYWKIEYRSPYSIGLLDAIESVAVAETVAETVVSEYGSTMNNEEKERKKVEQTKCL